MAKSATVRKLKEANINIELLKQIANGAVRFIAKTQDAEALLTHNPPLIEINIAEVNPSNKLEVSCRVTPAGAALIVETNPINESKNMSFEVVNDSGFEIPVSKRGGRGGGAPSKYPFDTLSVGGLFFVPATTTMRDPAKKLGSTVSSANHRYATHSGEVRTVERSKRGAKNRLILDDAGNKIMEQKNVPVLQFTRKFKAVPVKAGETYGRYTAPSDGAVIVRVA